MLNTFIFQQCLNEDDDCSRQGRSFSLKHLKFSVKRRSNRLITLVWWFLYYFVLNSRRGLFNCSFHTVSTMGTKMKGIYKGFKYISQIFVVKEREMDIGYPTDVKHVAHIGWDGPSGSAPTWMNEFKTGPDFASTSIGHSGSALSPWSSQDYGDSMTQQSAPSDIYRDGPPPTDVPRPKKHRRKKNGSTSSPRSGGSSSRSSRASKSKAKLIEGNNAKPINIEMA